MEDYVVTLETDNFETYVQSERPVLVDFWAAWCGPCKMMAPVVEDIAAHFEERLLVAKLNVDENSGIATDCGIMNIPTLVLFKNGKEEERFIGFHTKDDLVLALESKL